MDEIKRYKNILIPLAVCAVFFIVLKQFHESKQREAQLLREQIVAIEKKIELAERIDREKEQFLHKAELFIGEDADAFLGRVTRYARDASLEILSAKLFEEAGRRGQRKRSGPGGAKDQVLERYDVEVTVCGGASQIGKLVELIDKEEVFVAISSMKLSSTERIERNGTWKRAAPDKTVEGVIRVVGMAVSKLDI